MVVGWKDIKRRFDGKIYRHHDWYTSKRNAKEEASRLRKQGYLCRVTTCGTNSLDCYYLWKRKK